MHNFKQGVIASAVLLTLPLLANSVYAATDYPSGFKKCAQNKGQTCSFSGTRQVALGKKGEFVYATFTDGVECDASNFPSNNFPSSAWCSFGAVVEGGSSSTSSSSSSSSTSSSNSSTGGSSSSTSSSSNSSSTSSSSSSSNSSSGSNSGSEITIQENATGFCSADGAIESNHSGYTGSGFANTENTNGSAINYRVNVPSSGYYTIEVQYASSTTRGANVSVNGSNRGSLDLPGTGAWDSWTSDTATIQLDAGNNDISLVATSGGGLPNVDYIKLVGDSLTAISCDNSSSSSSSSSSNNSSSSSSTSSTSSGGSSSSSTSSSSNSSSSSSGGSSIGSADSSMGGFASVSKYGVKTTTGGQGGSTVTVSNFDDLKKHAESDERVIIKVRGTISAPGVHGLIKVRSNKTIIGQGSNARLNKVTLTVNSWNRAGESCDADDKDSFTPASNVIIRNLEFTGLADFPDDTKVDPDAIRVECYSHHVWIDHNTFQYGADGATDVKRGADLVTISYNHYVKTKKTALIGHSDNNGSQDKGYLNVTFHHNYFDGTETRTPRVRFGYAHVYNNYYNFSNHAFRIGPEGRIYAEGNYVASSEGKILRDTENEGSLTWTSSNVWDKGAYGEVGTKLLDADQSVSKPPYSYSAGSASSSPPNAGHGKI